MMKRLFVAFSLSLLAWCLPAQTISAPLTPADFQYCTDVKGAFKAELLYQIHLTDEIIQKTAPGFEDLRLFDAASKEITSILIGNNPPFDTVETYPLEIT